MSKEQPPLANWISLNKPLANDAHTQLQSLKAAIRDQAQLVNAGSFSHVVRILSTDLVIKIRLYSKELQTTERKIYERLGLHPRILRYYGQLNQGHGGLPGGLVFEYLPAGTLLGNLSVKGYSGQRIGLEISFITLFFNSFVKAHD